jgi:hypothetical protein
MLPGNQTRLHPVRSAPNGKLVDAMFYMNEHSVRKRQLVDGGYTAGKCPRVGFRLGVDREGLGEPSEP